MIYIRTLIKTTFDITNEGVWDMDLGHESGLHMCM
jgi:hypothetical protein